MTKKLTSLFARIARLLYASDRGRKAAAPWGGLGPSIGLVARHGGGAMVALQALHLPEGEHSPGGSGPRRDGRIAAALIMGLSLAHALTLQPAGSARPEASVHVSNEAARAASAGQKRTLTPITAGMRRPTQTADRDVQLAAFNPAAIAIAPPRDRRTPLEDVVIDAIVAYTKAAARDYRDIVGEVSSPPSKETTSPSA